MRSFLAVGLLFFSTLFFINCQTAEVSNANTETNQNVNADQAINANQSNANTETAATEEVPVFEDAGAALKAGNEYLDDNETKKAIDAYKQAVKLDADLAEAHFRLGIAYALVEDEEEKTDVPEDEPTPAKKPRRSRKGKKDADLPRTNSVIAFENAVKAYKKIIAKNPKDDVAHYNLGRSYNKLNEDEEAAKSLKQAVKLKPDDTEYQTMLGEALINLAQYDEAVSALKKAVKLDETNLRAEDLLARAEAGKKRVDFGANKIKNKQ